MPKKKKYNTKTVEAIRHDEATRKNIPTAEYQSVMRETEVGIRSQESGVGRRGSEVAPVEHPRVDPVQRGTEDEGQKSSSIPAEDGIFATLQPATSIPGHGISATLQPVSSDQHPVSGFY